MSPRPSPGTCCPPSSASGSLGQVAATRSPVPWSRWPCSPAQTRAAAGAAVETAYSHTPRSGRQQYRFAICTGRCACRGRQGKQQGETSNGRTCETETKHTCHHNWQPRVQTSYIHKAPGPSRGVAEPSSNQSKQRDAAAPQAKQLKDLHQGKRCSTAQRSVKKRCNKAKPKLAPHDVPLHTVGNCTHHVLKLGWGEDPLPLRGGNRRGAAGRLSNSDPLRPTSKN